MSITIADLRRFTVARNFRRPGELKRTLQMMGFVQADPIRAPARAQDLILRHRVKDYHAGDLERLYETLPVAEDFFVNYGYVSKELQRLMHPRSDARAPAADIGDGWSADETNRAGRLLEFVRARGEVHPREVDAYFAHGKVTNYWGGSSNATTHLMDAMHYRGWLRVVRREKGTRIYAEHEHGGGANNLEESRKRMDSLVDAVVRIYAPLPDPSLAFYVRRLRFAAPQWRNDVKTALERAKHRLVHARVGEINWYWPTAERIGSRYDSPDIVRLLTPFDPVVHDRARFEVLWGWVYRFEAYTPAAKRKLGYYAMPLLWRDQIIGWANLSLKKSQLTPSFGYVRSHAPRERAFKQELDAEVDRMREFLLL